MAVVEIQSPTSSNMIRNLMLTNQQLIEIINDLDPEVETVFRKYSSLCNSIR